MGEEGATLADLFALAIAAEESAETLYRGLAIKFSRYADVADFWRQYAAEESGHALWLMRLRDRLDTEQLATPADPFALENVYRALHMSVETALAQIQNLEDAYQLVNDIESSETNAVFSFLVTNFAITDYTLGADLDVVGFDACLMGMIEVAWALKDDADYFVASQASEPGDGWDYANWLNLWLSGDITAERLATTEVVTYGDFYAGSGDPWWTLTQSAVDMSQLDALGSAIDDFMVSNDPGDHLGW